ncbi:MAG: hypothetical protein COU66_01070 [Candidatus Pacebacteria bacterium CG10_big_fil_rev_8_21_14_0_10_44_11]|nr:MAG: hypothetical protein COU66_01070 [Candidatus Pacebacteria bacterium CG10_big_fil_rev_8_21_14_0_10_44_11]
MKITNFAITLALVIAFGFLLTRLTQAQEATDSARMTATESAEANPDLVFTKPRQTKEILQLRELYQDQVEKYSSLERQYLISKAQYEKLNTLQSLEEAIQSSREVMLSRTDVLITYFELMRASLDDTEGVELSEKDRLTGNMINYILKLRAHRQDVLNSKIREDITARADEFATLSAPFESTAYQSMALIRIGDIQAVYDKSLIIYKDILQYHVDNPTNLLRQAERDRAYREVNKAIEITQRDLLTIRTQYANQQTMTRSSFSSNLGKALSQAYSGTSQILSFLEELFVELT